MPPKITKVRWSAANLPWGISFNEQTGTFTGTPEDEGEYDIPITIETNYGRHQEYVHMSVIKNIVWEKVDIGNINMQEKTPIMLRLIRGDNNFRHFMIPIFDGSYQRYINCSSSTSRSVWGVAAAFESDYFFDKIYGIVETVKNKFVYIIGENAGGKIRRFPDGGGGAVTLYTPPFYTSKWYAACHSSTLDVVFYFDKEGRAIKITSASTATPVMVSSYYATGISNINTNCAAWSNSVKKVCVSSSDGQVAVSADGVIWTTANTPDNLVELEYREDLGKFFARGENTKLFYVSEDGLTWIQYSIIPFPLDEVHASTYSSIYGYCVIGYLGSETYSIHSEDFSEWTFKKMANTNIRFTNVVESCLDNGFVAIPYSGGSYLYRLQYE